MRQRRRNSRALAEIVGTLMLVLIVVAAATAFAFFVASYQRQLTAEETLTHDKDLENLRVLALTPDVDSSTQLTGLQIELASLDVNAIAVDSILLDSSTILNYNVTLNLTSGDGLPGCLLGSPYANSTNTACVLDLPPESHVFLSFSFFAPSTSHPNKYYSFPAENPLTLSETSLLTFDIFTSLGNEFIQSFVPPVAVVGLTFVSGFPILDGSNSYQPGTETGVNVTIVDWEWSVTNASGSGACAANSSVRSDCGSYSGQEVELPAPFFTSSSYTQTYAISLTVVNEESLLDATEVFYPA